MYEQLFSHSSLDDNFTFTLRSHTLRFKTQNWPYAYTYECFLIADTFTAIILIVSFTSSVLKKGNLNIQIGVTPKLHTLGRYLLFSDISAKGLNFWKCQQRPLTQNIVLWNECELTVYMRIHACRNNSCASVDLLQVIFVEILPPYFDGSVNTALKQEWF